MAGRLTDRAHERLRACLRAGDTAVDATAGNGHDTVFLARAVGAAGRVWAFDLQRAALEETSRRLGLAGLLGRVTLVEAGHEAIGDHVPARPAPAAFTFNLGYLPGSDKTVATRPETTLRALGQALGLLAPGGLCTVVAYRGHRGGREEAEAVVAWAGSLDPGRVGFETEGGLGRADAPVLVVVRAAGLRSSGG